MAQIRPNKAKAKLRAGGIVNVIGGLNDSDMVDAAGTLGVDAVWFEGEHGGVDFQDISDLTRACDLWGLTSIVRVGFNNANVIYRTLDRGAQGIVVPHVNTRAEAEAVVDAAKFAPIGHRGMFTSRQGYGVGDYLKVANEQTMVVVLIEDIVAIRNLDDILKVEHIDVFLVAPSDLAQSMGHIGDMGHPEVQKVIDEAAARISRAGRVAGHIATADTAGPLVRKGFRFLLANSGDWLARGAQQYLSAVQTAKK
jgi:4-hydroxy-2-oxoheptanedioate aldolase